MIKAYFDNNATTKVAPEVIEAMGPFFSELWGNPSSMHHFGGQVAEHVEDARAKVAALIGAQPEEIVFTSCGTESDNAAVRGAVAAMGPQARILTSRVEHPAVLGPCRYLGDQGHDLVELPVDARGLLDLNALKRELSRGPAVVSLMWANNETGVIFPMQEVAEMVNAAGSILHTDAVQAVGKLPIDVTSTPLDMLSLSGHKLHAPKGIGALYVRRGTRLHPYQLGGHQEKGRRGGTENVPYIVGLGKAAELAKDHLEKGTAGMAALRDRLEQRVLEICPDTQVNGDREARLPNTSNVSFLFIEGESILYDLSEQGIAASSGSACTSGSLEPSHVIRAMGVPFTAAHGSIRFSLSRYSTEEEVDYLLERLPPIVERLRAMSPFV